MFNSLDPQLGCHGIKNIDHILYFYQLVKIKLLAILRTFFFFTKMIVLHKRDFGVYILDTHIRSSLANF